MKTNITQIVAPTAITAIMDTYYTATTVKPPILSRFSVTNTGAADLFSVEVAGVEVVAPFTIDDNETVTIWQLEGHELAGGDTLACKGSVDMNIFVTGMEIY